MQPHLSPLSKQRPKLAGTSSEGLRDELYDITNTYHPPRRDTAESLDMKDPVPLEDNHAPIPDNVVEEIFEQQRQHGVGLKTLYTHQRFRTRSHKSRISDDEAGVTEEDQTESLTWVPGISLSRSKLTQDLPHVVPKFRTRGLESFEGICNKDTISKDRTTTNESYMDVLLARCGRKVMGTHHQEQQDEIRKDDSSSEPYFEPYSSKIRDNDSLFNENLLDKEETANERMNPPPISKEYQDKTEAALNYIQAARVKGSYADHVALPTDSPDVDDKAYNSSGLDKNYSLNNYTAKYTKRINRSFSTKR
ncbi:Uncharacterized protein HZ326_26708 [Fusarium oxysporum f. sp. albedinis]|nr:Uncharacterized protein HZ326_26708 [Fusarium oxysporum f. sp. albedinis]